MAPNAHMRCTHIVASQIGRRPVTCRRHLNIFQEIWIYLSKTLLQTFLSEHFIKVLYHSTSLRHFIKALYTNPWWNPVIKVLYQIPLSKSFIQVLYQSPWTRSWDKVSRYWDNVLRQDIKASENNRLLNGTHCFNLYLPEQLPRTFRNIAGEILLGEL